MPDAYSQLSETLDSYIDAKFSQFYKRVETLVNTHRIGSDQLLPNSVTSPKLGNSIDAKIESIIAPLIADSQITTYYQAEPPIALAVGNLWIDTDSGNSLKRWDGSSWVAVDNSQLQEALTAAGDAQATADGKIVTFAQESSPTATSIGDLWIDTNDNNKLYRWNGTSWATAQDGLLASHASAISSLTSSISAKTTIYYQISAPSSPATGDIWYDTDASPVVIYRWGGSSWANITTTALSSALAAASTAQSTADGKIRTFAQSTAPTGMATGDVGDLWVDTDDNNKLYRYSGSVWVAVQDTHNDALVATHSEAISSLNDVVDGKTTVFYQTSQPSSPATGDIWYDTDAVPVVIYRWSGSAWVNITTAALSAALAAAGDAQSTADGKVRSFAQTTAPGSMTAEDAGDLWVDTDDNNRLYRYNGSTWVSVQDGLIASHSTAISSLTTSVGGKTTIYYQTSQPTATATGDVWYDTDATPTVIYRWDGSAWIDITTTTLSAALSAANTAQSTADGKIETYAQTTAPTGMAASDVGDLWVDTDDNNKLYRYNGSTWVSVQDGLISSHTTAIAGLTTSLSGKTTIYYQTSQPTATATGDIWYDTDASPVTIKRWSGSAWVDITTTALSQALAAAADAQSTADGKIRTFAQDTAPTGMYESDVGDLWVDTNDNNKLYRWGGTGWFSVQDTHYDSVVSALTSSINAKTTIFYKASTPTANVVGDMWYDTDAVPVVIYRWSGSEWVNITTVALSQALAAASNAQTTADGKINSYAQASAPTGLTSTDVGDFWVDTDNNNKLYRWDGSYWVSVQDGSKLDVSSPSVGVETPGIKIVEGELSIETPVLSVNVTGVNGDMTLDETGLTVNKVTSPSVQPQYTDASTIYVNPAATDAQVEAKTHYRSIAMAFAALNGKNIPYDMVVSVAAGTYYDGLISLRGVSGAGQVVISGTGVELKNTAIDLRQCTVIVAITGLTIGQSATDQYGIYVDACRYVRVNNCTITAMSASSTSVAAISARSGSNVVVTGTAIYGAWEAIQSRDSSTVYSINNKGNARLSVSQGQMIVEGTQPCDVTTFGYTRSTGGILTQAGAVTVDQGTATTPEPVTTTTTFAANMTHTVYGSTLWPGSWKSTTNEVWQGYSSGSKYQSTLLWFSGISALSGKTILSAKLRIRRVPGSGKGDSVKLVGYYGDRAYNAGSGSPSNRVSMGSIGNISESNSLTTFTIPIAAASYLAANSTGRCIALNPGDSSVLSGKTYSSNYAKFSGIGSSYVPELVVTYET